MEGCETSGRKELRKYHNSTEKKNKEEWWWKGMKLKEDRGGRWEWRLKWLCCFWPELFLNMGGCQEKGYRRGSGFWENIYSIFGLLLSRCPEHIILELRKECEINIWDSAAKKWSSNLEDGHDCWGRHIEWEDRSKDKTVGSIKIYGVGEKEKPERERERES